MSCLTVAVLLVLSQVVSALDCSTVIVQSSTIGDYRFKQIPIDKTLVTEINKNYAETGRPSYVATGEGGTNMYLYHILFETTGVGRWVINNELNVQDQAVAFVDSWAVTPYLVEATSGYTNRDVTKWMSSSEGVWSFDYTTSCYCSAQQEDDRETDKAIFFDSETTKTPNLSGYYVQRVLAQDPSEIIYSKVRSHDNENIKYIYKFENKWMISETIGDDSCFAFKEVGENVKYIDDIVDTPDYAAWNFVSTRTNDNNEMEYEWTQGWAYVYSQKPTENAVTPHLFGNIMEAVIHQRALKFVPEGQTFLNLRNNLVLPTMGQGTGGISFEDYKTAMHTSILQGYRYFDLAREYKNERIVAELLSENTEDETFPLRSEVFLQTKVWPTNLGFYETSDEILNSLNDLMTTYVDNYMLHWPYCDPGVEWMHCEDTVNPEGTWQHSYRALEKAYAEGTIMSIGISNFNIELLNELEDFAVVLPHIVQNFAEVGKLDMDVRYWCLKHNVVYQPYASLRNLKSLPKEMQTALKLAGDSRGMSPYVASLAFFVQTGASVIPRSTDKTHMMENLLALRNKFTDEEMKALGWSLVIAEAEL